MKKFLILGLGNIGPEYEETRHNIGFKVLDHLADRSGTFFVSDRLGSRAEIKEKGRSITLIKPSTYMNLSGKAAQYWLQKLNIPIEQMLVVVDDIALPFGTLRIKSSGSPGGHNGLKSMEAVLGTGKYPRLRVGIGDDFGKGRQVDYVLGEWSEEEREKLSLITKSCGDAVISFVLAGLGNTMNGYNGEIKGFK